MKHRFAYYLWLLFLLILAALGVWLIAAVFSGQLPRYPEYQGEGVLVALRLLTPA